MPDVADKCICAGMAVIDRGRIGVVVKGTSELQLACAGITISNEAHCRRLQDIVATIAGVKYPNYKVERLMPVRTSTITCAHHHQIIAPLNPPRCRVKDASVIRRHCTSRTWR